MTSLYAGNILIVDLSNDAISKVSTSNYASSFFGGRGINIKLFSERISHGIDPLGPENVLIFGVGPLGGTTIATGRTEVTAKSPETGFLGSSNFGGYFAAELKYAGYDHIVITGIAKKPVYIYIYNDHVEIKDANRYWGEDTYKTQDAIRKDIGDPEVKIACIGPAGEKLVRFATIQHEHGHAAGRTGMGTVMGSKNLKAIVVRGTNKLTVADPQKFLQIAEEVKETVKMSPDAQLIIKTGLSELQDRDMKESGSVESLPGFNVNEPPKMFDIFLKYPSKKAGCLGCQIQCMDHFEGEGLGSGVISCELYGEWTLAVGLYDSKASLELGIMSQRYGVDCSSAGEIIHWLMELHEEGIITKGDTDGIPMEWGNAEAIRSMLDKIVFREGVGDVLAEGILEAINYFGNETEKYACHSRGLPMNEVLNPNYLPHYKGTSLGNALGPRGDSMRGFSIVGNEMGLTPEMAKEITGIEKGGIPEEYEGKPELQKLLEDICIISDMLSTCKFYSVWALGIYTPENQAAILSAGIGKEISIEELFDFANKIRTLEYSYDVSEGFTRKRQTLPKSFFKPIEKGLFKGECLEPEKFEKMKTRYYELRGWDADTGIPTEETLSRYGIEEAVRNFSKNDITTS